MTSTPSIHSEENPEEETHDWHPINVNSDVECKMNGMDTYQLRNKDSIITVNRKAFDLYRAGDFVTFQKYCKELGIESKVREDDES